MKGQKQVHSSANTGGTDEWGTPPHIIAAAREVLGGIDLDPFSNDLANQTVGATTYHTANNPYAGYYAGRVWCNPPYSLLDPTFTRRMVASYELGFMSQALILVPARTDTRWGQPFLQWPVCFVTGRLRFLLPDGARGESAPFPSMVVYIGDDPAPFARVFGRLGVVMIPVLEVGV
jgi:hypothetical protein